MIRSHSEGKRLSVRKKSTGFALRDGCKVRATQERSTQARQRAVEVGLHGCLRHVERARDLLEGQLSETAQVDDRAKLRGQCSNSLLQRTMQVDPLGDLLWQGIGVGDGL